MKYLLLGLAIVFEVIGTGFMQKSEGFTKLIPSLATCASYIVCFFLFSQSLKFFPLGLAYAIWAGLGIVLTALVSFAIFKQRLDLPAVVGIVFIVIGVFIMNFFSKTIHP